VKPPRPPAAGAYLAPPPAVFEPRSRPSALPADAVTRPMPPRDVEAVAPEDAPDCPWPRAPRREPTPTAVRLAESLRDAGRPVPTLVARFPHLMNRVAGRWDDPPAVLAALDELLVDRRGDRRGLPAAALAEVLRLRSLCLQRAIAAARIGGTAPRG
jgi:hypothetical protein